MQQWRNRHAAGDIVRYADDSVPGFQYESEARRFLAALRERMARFGLELHPGQNATDPLRAVRRAAKPGAGNPEAADV